MGPQRTVHCADAREWLSAQEPLVGCSFITSLPDLSEVPALSVAEWKLWFIDCVTLILSKCPDEGVAIFYQSDVKRQGVWVDKGYLCLKAAEASGVELLWHKIVCRKPPGTRTTGRASYTHMLCFSRGVRTNLAVAEEDVLPSAGAFTWARGMGLEACRMACRFVLANTATRTIVDPFCGHGSALAVANEMGLDAIGVELSARRARRSRTRRIEDLLKAEEHAESAATTPAPIEHR